VQCEAAAAILASEGPAQYPATQFSFTSFHPGMMAHIHFLIARELTHEARSGGEKQKIKTMGCSLTSACDVNYEKFIFGI